MQIKVKVHKVIDEKRTFRDQKTGANQERRVLTIGGFTDDGELVSLVYYVPFGTDPKIPNTGASLLCSLVRYESESAIMGSAVIREFEAK